jgi:hypothetical protein
MFGILLHWTPLIFRTLRRPSTPGMYKVCYVARTTHGLSTGHSCFVFGCFEFVSRTRLLTPLSDYPNTNYGTHRAVLPFLLFFIQTSFQTFSFSLSDACAGRIRIPINAPQWSRIFNEKSVILMRRREGPLVGVLYQPRKRDEYEAVGKIRIDKGNRTLEENPPQCHFIHQKFHMA